MNVKDFEYIIELGRQGSISKASQVLYISQPALSKFLRKMEEEAGTLLFQRVGKRLVPTPAGEHCIRTASEILYLHNSLQQNLADIAKQSSGEIKLGLPFSRSNYVLARILPMFYQKYPHICIQIYEDGTRSLIQKLRAGELDLVFANMLDEDYPALTYEFISEEEMVLAIPSNYQLNAHAFYVDSYRYPCLHIDDWIHYPFLMLARDQLTRSFVDQYFQEHEQRPNTILKIRNLNQCLFSVQQGLGITICPSMPLIFTNPDIEIQYFSLPSSRGAFVRKTAIAYRKDAYLSIAEKDLIRIIKLQYA